MTYYGMGPDENYVDMKQAAHLGLFKTTVQDMHIPYLMPQDHGVRTDTRLLTVTDGLGRGLLFAAREGFEFAVSKYPEHMLKMAKHDMDLESDERTYLRIDCKNSGIGSGSCGPLPKDKYLLKGDFSYSFRLLPLVLEDAPVDLI